MKTDDDKVEVFHARDGWRWHRKSANGEIVSVSGEAFTDHTYALESATSLNPGVPLVDVDSNKEL